MHIGRIVDVKAWEGALDSIFIESVSIPPETMDEDLQEGPRDVE